MKYTIIFLVLSLALAVCSANVADTTVKTYAARNKQVKNNKQADKKSAPCNTDVDCHGPCHEFCPDNDGVLCYAGNCVCKPRP